MFALRPWLGVERAGPYSRVIPTASRRAPAIMRTPPLSTTTAMMAPLVAFYHDGPVDHLDGKGGFPGIGERDFASKSVTSQSRAHDRARDRG